MVLQVAIEDFADTVRRVLGENVEAYVAYFNGSAVATASGEGNDRIIASCTKQPIEEVKATLQEQGLRVFSGRWTDDIVLEAEGIPMEDFYVAGISYKTDGGPPGLWLDAFPQLPTQVQVLKGMYEELIQTGEMAEVAFEEFVRMSDANVVITSPTELRSYLGEKLNKDAKPDKGQ